MNWKTFLVAHDFSSGAAKAQSVAGDLARISAGRVVLLHVTPLPPGMVPTTLVQSPEGAALQVDEFTARAALDRLEQWAAPLRSAGIEVETVALLGGIAETILDEAKRRDVDVIVMGTHGRRGLAHLLLGSVAERVIRAADVPVITVRSPGDDLVPMPEAIPLAT